VRVEGECVVALALLLRFSINQRVRLSPSGGGRANVVWVFGVLLGLLVSLGTGDERSN
jgi:hypothetical protein